ELPSSLRRLTIAMLWITVLLTFSRGAIGFGLAVIIRAANNRFRRIVAGVSAVAAVALICSMSLWHLSLDPSHPRALHFDFSVPSSRRQAVVTTLHTITASPLSGSGVGSSPGLYDGVPFDAHMTAVNIAGTLGLPALIAFAATLTLLWRNRSRPTDLALWSGFAGLAVDALAQDVEDFRHVWVLLGLAASKSKSEDPHLY
ncbi:MAG TPA: hypothetical protein VNS63_03085, partial [Blastocatellia bacterium]|nr:hypothetical protein [Blastocatellia bacterium]